MLTISNPIADSNIKKWMSGRYGEEAKTEIQQLLDGNQEAKLIDAFYKNLEFGTGGLRGIMGVGSNRMNRYTVGMATQGLANYLKISFPNQVIKVAIAHDCRNQSDYFAKITAQIFSANGIQVYFFEELRPTPELSFAIRQLGCQSGVVITASHNPKEYNGYKAYWDDGAQLVAPHDTNVIAEVENIQIEAVRFEGIENNIHYIGKEIDELFLQKVSEQVLAIDAIEAQKELKIVYTPLHGTGITLIPQLLQKIGFRNITLVEEQATPDGNFPTLVYPNPEEAEALTLALKKAKEIDADLILATDPDADRVGIAVKNHHNEWQLINGNQTGSLIFYYLLKNWKENNKLTGNEYIVKTIVTTDIIDAIALNYGVECINTLTGFKYIASVIRELEGQKTFIAGGEESYGYMIGDFVRDKDSISSCAIIAEMSAYANNKGFSLFDMLMEMYLEYGFYFEKMISITKKGKAGAEEIQTMMDNFRKNPPSTLAGSEVVSIKDYQSLTDKNILTGEVKTINLERSNVIQLITKDGSKISARPSGTEPKIKFYFSVNKNLKDKADFDATENELELKTNRIIEELGLV